MYSVTPAQSKMETAYLKEAKLNIDQFMTTENKNIMQKTLLEEPMSHQEGAVAAIEEAAEAETEAGLGREVEVVIGADLVIEAEIETEDHHVKSKEEQSLYGKIQVLGLSDLVMEVKIYLSIVVD